MKLPSDDLVVDIIDQIRNSSLFIAGVSVGSCIYIMLTEAIGCGEKLCIRASLYSTITASECKIFVFYFLIICGKNHMDDLLVQRGPGWV